MISVLKRLRYYDTFLAILIPIIGMGLVFGILFTNSQQSNRILADSERIFLRNQVVKLEIENQIQFARQSLAEARLSIPPDASSDFRGAILENLNSRYNNRGGYQWVLLDRNNPEMITFRDEVLVTSKLPVSDLDEYVAMTTAGASSAVVFLDETGAPEIWLLFDIDERRSRPYIYALRRSIGSYLIDFEVGTPLRTEIIVLDSNGYEIARAGFRPLTEPIIPSGGTVPGFLASENRIPYLGPMNRFIWSEEPQLIHTDDTFSSIIPFRDIGLFLILQDRGLPPARSAHTSTVVFVVIGVLLYTLIILLFLSFRQLVIRQTRSLAAISEQKDTLFSLLSHNLKNHLAAITAETLKRPDNDTVLAQVEEASRVISNSLYYLQLQEARFPVLPREEVGADELVEFLVMRVQRLAGALGHDIRLVDCSERPRLMTNLNMALEALERILVNALQRAPQGGNVVIEIGADADAVRIVFSDNGPPLSADLAYELLYPFGENDTSALQTKRNLHEIGLYLSRMILESLGATIEYVERDAGNAGFAVVFPRTKSKTSAIIGSQTRGRGV